MLSPEEALACDLASAAEGRGTTIEQEFARHRAAEILGELSQRIAEARPGSYAGAALLGELNTEPTIYIKGPADAFIRELVAAAEVEIDIRDNLPYSVEELDQRQLRLDRALIELGYGNFSTSTDVESGQLLASITIQSHLPSSAEELLELLPHDLRSGVDIAFSTTPVGVDTIPD